MIVSSAIHAGPHELRALDRLAVCACGRTVFRGRHGSRDGRCESCNDRALDLRNDSDRGYLDNEDAD